MIRVGAGTQHKKRKKNSRPKFLSSASLCDQNFSSAFALKKHQSPFLSTLITHVKENERNGQDYQKYALFVPFLRLFFSPSLSLFCSRAALSSRSYSFSLSFQNAFVCAFVCARLCVSSGLIFVSEFCFHLNHKFSSRALSYVLTLCFLSLSSRIIFSLFSLLHRRRLRRRTDHGHDRSEVPAHRGNIINTLFFCETMI